MRSLKVTLRRTMAMDRRAVTSLEYGLIGAFVLLVIVGSVKLAGQNLIPIFTSVAAGL